MGPFSNIFQWWHGDHTCVSNFKKYALVNFWNGKATLYLNFKLLKSVFICFQIKRRKLSVIPRNYSQKGCLHFRKMAVGISRSPRDAWLEWSWQVQSSRFPWIHGLAQALLGKYILVLSLKPLSMGEQKREKLNRKPSMFSWNMGLSRFFPLDQ